MSTFCGIPLTCKPRLKTFCMWEVDEWLPRVGGRGERVLIDMQLFGGDEPILKLDDGNGYTPW